MWCIETSCTLLRFRAFWPFENCYFCSSRCFVSTIIYSISHPSISFSSQNLHLHRVIRSSIFSESSFCWQKRAMLKFISGSNCPRDFSHTTTGLRLSVSFLKFYESKHQRFSLPDINNMCLTCFSSNIFCTEKCSSQHCLKKAERFNNVLGCSP